MIIESIKIQNYKIFQNAQATHIPNMAVFLGKNGTGKTTFFDVFGFLHDCLSQNVNSALSKRGGYKEVISRGHHGEDISFVKSLIEAGDLPGALWRQGLLMGEQA